jgi:signal transduction histidine kinase
VGRDLEAITTPAEIDDISAAKLNWRIGSICTVLAVGVFSIDVASLPLGVAAGVFYVGVVLVSLWFSKWQYTFIVAGSVSVLTVLGYFMSEPAGVIWMVIANRLLALASIWLVAFGGSWLVLSKRRKAEEFLRRVEQDADRARKAKSRFLDASSNDIRHHLQTLMLLNGALHKTISEPKTQKIIGKQGDALADLGDLMNSLLEISELESGETEFEITDVAIHDIFQKLQEEFDYQARAKGLMLNFNCESGVARSDSTLLLRAIRLLISNAIRYTSEGTITVSSKPVAEGLRVTVKDTGIGIAPDQLARIFDEFYKVDNDPAGRHGGLGLGLTIVEQSLGLLNGKIEVDSEPGRGSSFSLLLPAAA